jgi:hypothetical protein
MITLEQEQIDNLQEHLNNGNIALFYNDLQVYGDDYGRLGKAVTLNSTWQGQMANGFAANAAARNGVDLTFGSNDWNAVNSALAQSYLDGYVQNSNKTPSWEYIQDIHNQKYNDFNIPENGWLPNKPLNDSDVPKDLWLDYQNNDSAVDLWEDAGGILDSSGMLDIYTRQLTDDEIN